mgnify:CR=1 FL=1
MYGEAVGGKNFKQGVQLACIVEASDFDYNTDEFGPDAQQDSQFHILRETLLELSLTPEIGDIVEWNYGFFEVNGILEKAGHLEVSDQTFVQLLEIASKGPTVGNKKDSEDVRNKVIQLYTLLVSSPEFQLA